MILACACLCGCSPLSEYSDLQKSLSEFVDGKNADIGIAVIIDGKDTVAVNGNKNFPMLSVYKFPIAITLAAQYRNQNLSLDHPIAVLPTDLHPDTYSPMTQKILSSSDMFISDTLKIPAKQLLKYMLQQSDNNASDIVLRETGGPDYVESYLKEMHIAGVNVRNSEDEMHLDNALCYANSTTPIAMASLFDKFDMEFNDSISLEIKQLMETCETGANRLPKPLMTANGVIGHKTGTGFVLADGRLMAVNDAGYVHLPNGHRYAIAVFIRNSLYDMPQTEALIAEISEIVFSSVN